MVVVSPESFFETPRENPSRFGSTVLLVQRNCLVSAAPDVQLQPGGSISLPGIISAPAEIVKTVSAEAGTFPP